MNTPPPCDTILHEVREGVLHIVFNRPQQRNALTFEMYLQLAWLFTLACEDSAVRVVLLSGAGNYFSAGNDLNDFVEFSADDEFVPVHFLRALTRCDKPIVAAVEGGAIGIGATMLLHCDVVYVDAETRFRMPFINFGLCPEGASSLLMPKNAGYKQAVRWLMLGEQFSSADACAAGLATQVVPAGEAMASAMHTVHQLLALAPMALQQTKRLMRRADSAAVQETIDIECVEFVQLLASTPAQAALSEYLRRRGN
jgi:enoyl-CoA hydratase/carnithine racemase